MKWMPVLTFLTFFAAPLVHGQVSFDDCDHAGVQTGESVTAQFCRTLEARYHGSVYPEIRAQFYRPIQFCSLDIAHSCREAARDMIRSFPVCESLVRRNWQNSSDSFRTIIAEGCPLPEIVSCPFPNARVHKGFWCKPRFRNTYWAYIDGVWWQFLRNGGGHGDEKQYLVRAADGAVRFVSRYDLTIVSAY